MGDLVNLDAVQAARRVRLAVDFQEDARREAMAAHLAGRVLADALMKAERDGVPRAAVLRNLLGAAAAGLAAPGPDEYSPDEVGAMAGFAAGAPGAARL